MIEVREYTAKEISFIVGGKLIGKDQKIKYISTDSREISGGNVCFFAINGNRYNGVEFVNDAVKNGVNLVIGNCKKIDNVSVIQVEDGKIALCRLAKHHKGNTKIIGVVGSVGKTTVKEMIRSVLATKYRVCATYKNYNNEIGVAKTLLSIKDEEYCVVEMGMRKLGEIDFLSSLAEPEISVITNAFSSHIELLGSCENIFKAKTEVLNHTKSYCIIPYDERFLSINYGTLNPIFLGKYGDYYIDDISYTPNGIKFFLNGKKLNEEFIVNSFSIHDAKNALCAYTVGKLCGIDLDDIKTAFLNFKNCEMRSNFYNIAKIDLIDDCYNASYESVKSAISSLCEYSKFVKKTPYALIGDMLEIGSGSEEYHFRIGEYAKDIGVKNVFSIGKFAENILDGFCGGIKFSSNDEIITYIAENLGNNDVLLVKASRDAHFEKIIEGLKERINEN